MIMRKRTRTPKEQRAMFYFLQNPRKRRKYQRIRERSRKVGYVTKDELRLKSASGRQINQFVTDNGTLKPSAPVEMIDGIGKRGAKELYDEGITTVAAFEYAIDADADADADTKLQQTSSSRSNSYSSISFGRIASKENPTMPIGYGQFQDSLLKLMQEVNQREKRGGMIPLYKLRNEYPQVSDAKWQDYLTKLEQERIIDLQIASDRKTVLYQRKSDDQWVALDGKEGVWWDPRRGAIAYAVVRRKEK